MIWYDNLTVSRLTDSKVRFSFGMRVLLMLFLEGKIKKNMFILYVYIIKLKMRTLFCSIFIYFLKLISSKK